jgi:hypothetical protein
MRGNRKEAAPAALPRSKVRRVKVSMRLPSPRLKETVKRRLSTARELCDAQSNGA